MKILNLFKRDIFRPINGVVKADQRDESAVWQELEEFVLTKELDQHFRKFVAWFLEAADPSGKHGNPSGKMGVWISGFFGSGKSHFLKVLSYLLHNQTHTYKDQHKLAVEFFEGKVPDALLFADIKRAVAADTDVVLFNIDSKADHGTGRDLILRVFLKVLNELQGYSGDHPHLAHMERHLASKGVLTQFHQNYRKHTGLEWVKERDAYQFNRDESVKALAETLGQSNSAAEKWFDGAESAFPLSVENFCKWVKDYLDSKGPQHRLAFLVDEVGQFIGNDSQLMLSLQTITEELGTICQRRAWVIVTSQEDMDSVLGDVSKTKRQDFSKIQGRFFPPLSLSSSNVDEVIQARLLAKEPPATGELEALFARKGDIVKNQLTFTNAGMTFKNIGSAAEFAKNYPFVPYQFQLLQKIFEAIRKAGATGSHLARGERSMLDAFQSAAKAVATSDIGVLVPLYLFYPSIESFLDTAVKKTIDQAKTNTGLEPFDALILQVLFLIRYVEEMNGNVDNLVTLCLDQVDGDRLALRRKIEGSLARLEKETLISRNGDLYYFLTNEERDINKEIKAIDLSSGEEALALGRLIFDEVFKGQRKHRFSANRMDFDFNRRCDDHYTGTQKDGALLVQVITPLNDDYASYTTAKCVLDSSADGGSVLIMLSNDDKLGRELRTFVQTNKYVSRKNDGTQSESVKVILRDCANSNLQRSARLTGQLADMIADANWYAMSQPLKLKAGAPEARLAEAMEYLIQNSFNKMGYLKRLTADADRLKEVQAILRANDIDAQKELISKGETNGEALDDIRNYLGLSAQASRPVVLHDMIDKRYATRPYGWPEEEVLILLARLLVLGEITLTMDSAALSLENTFTAITAPAKRRKILVAKRLTADPEAVRNARKLGKDLFGDMGPDLADALFGFLQGKFKDRQQSLAAFQPMAESAGYPGATTIADGLTLIKKLVDDRDSLKFIERFLTLKNDLVDFDERFRELEHFYGKQRNIWEKARKAHTQFALNRQELMRDEHAAPALARLDTILAAASPYSLIKELEGLINTVTTVNNSLLTDGRYQANQAIDKLYGQLTSDIAAAKGDAALRQQCLQPFELLRGRIEQGQSVAHLVQAQNDAQHEFDKANAAVAAFVAAKAKNSGGGPSVKAAKVIKPAELTNATYLETQAQVDDFLDTLRNAMTAALANNQRIQIR